MSGYSFEHGIRLRRFFLPHSHILEVYPVGLQV